MSGTQVSDAPDAATNRCGAALRFSGILWLALMTGLLAACGSESTAWGGSSAASGAGVGASAGLAWDPPIGMANLAGYRVYYGTAPGSYTQPLGQGVDTKKSTTITVTGLKTATQYYFAVTAYDTSNIESGFSNEVSKSIP